MLRANDNLVFDVHGPSFLIIVDSIASIDRARDVNYINYLVQIIMRIFKIEYRCTPILNRYFDLTNDGSTYCVISYPRLHFSIWNLLCSVNTVTWQGGCHGYTQLFVRCTAAVNSWNDSVNLVALN